MTRYLALILSCLLLVGGAVLGSGCTAHRNYHDGDRYRSDHRPPPPPLPHKDQKKDYRPDHRPDGPPPHYRSDRTYR